MRIYVTGDTHIPLDIGKLNTKEFPEQKELNRDDYVVILGDFGLYWFRNEEHRYWKEWLEAKPFTVLWIDGNHENHEWIGELPVSRWHGGKVHQTSENIIHLMRGECYEIGGMRFLAAGGAQSYDRWGRIPSVSWWEEELWNHREQENLFWTLDRMRADHVPFDYILSHTCPKSLLMPMFGVSPMEDPDPTAALLENVLEDLGADGFRDWYFGHWHQDKSLGRFHCRFQQITRIC